MQANTKRLRTPCCIFQEPDLCERVVRDWLTEDVDAIVIDDEDENRYWLVRQNGTVIAPTPGEAKALEMAKAFNISTEILTKEEYRAKFGRELVW